MTVSSESDRLTRVVVSTPKSEYGNASNLEKHNIGGLGDLDLAIDQHDTLKAVLRDFGAEVIDIPELPEHPNSVFVRDTAVSTPRGYLRVRLGLETREGEDLWMANTLDAAGERCVGAITAPGTVEGGDVVLAGTVAFISTSARTNEEGVRQFTNIMEPMGYEIRVIALPASILHLDKVLMTLSQEQILHCVRSVSPQQLKGFDGIGITCGGDVTANVICLGDRELIINSSNSSVIELLDGKDYLVHDLDLGEFAKGMGGPNCLIMPVVRSRDG